MIYNVTFLETNIVYLVISINPQPENLKLEYFNVFLNNVKFNDFTIKKINNSQYKIIPNNSFNIYDQILFYIKGDDCFSNHIIIYLCKTFIAKEEILEYDTSSLESGIYNLSTDKINDIDFKLDINNITICNGINGSVSSIYSDKNIYQVSDDIQLKLDLYDSNNKLVPNGNYVIKFKIEKI